LCIEEERVVAKDNTIAWNGKRLQIPASRLRPHFVKAHVRVHEYPDGTVSVFLGPHRLCAYTAEGKEIVSAPARPSLASCSQRSRPSPPGGRQGRPALTAAAREAAPERRAGTEKRASSRTKKRAKEENEAGPA
jgi:hypothetical protein